MFLQINNDWALSTDKLQWILQRRSGTRWRDVAFISSNKATLSRCMSENGVPAADAWKALRCLPDTFAESASTATKTTPADDKTSPPLSTLVLSSAA